MNIIIRDARIVDEDSSFCNQIVDLEIENGVISKIGVNLSNTNHFEELKRDNLHISQGWFDSSVSFGEPGFEDRETISNGLMVAAKSGFTAVALQPNSEPIIDNQAHINFVQSKANGFATQVYPIGALTKNSLGTDLAELFDMKKAGAIAFGDYNKNIENANLMKIALQYLQDFDGLLLAFCEDKNLKANGVANEGVIATQLGLKGNASLSEEMMVARNLFLLGYTGGKMHIPTISSSKSAFLIKEAKANGLQISCSVAVHHLTISDAVLVNFDSRHKVLPPLRDKNEQKLLQQLVCDGTIDCITSDHNPIDIEHKKVEFDLAKNGTIGLESAFGALHFCLPLNVVIRQLTNGRAVFGVKKPSISVGNPANITLFNPDVRWFFSEENILSKSKNTAFLGNEMLGKVYGVFNQNQLILA